MPFDWSRIDTGRKLAQLYGVSESQISNIVRRLQWREVA
jgi:predicted DNA binding protein